jgi:hypothetical protein
LHSLRKLLPILILELCFVAALGQEDRGRVNGLVTDSSGAVIPKATVSLLNEETKVVQNTVSDSAGEYVSNMSFRVSTACP